MLGIRRPVVKLVGLVPHKVPRDENEINVVLVVADRRLDVLQGLLDQCQGRITSQLAEWKGGIYSGGAIMLGGRSCGVFSAIVGIPVQVTQPQKDAHGELLLFVKLQ